MSKAEDLSRQYVLPFLDKCYEKYGEHKQMELSKFDGYDMMSAYEEGYHQAEKDLLDNIWHNPDEEPEIDRKIIWESENFLGKHLDKEWKPKIDCFGRKERWCYLADILPSKNWTGERPYSKVDYSRGYEQAEKDLELTWQDMFDIFRLVNEVLDDYADGKTKKEIGEEVLRRFKEIKK